MVFHAAPPYMLATAVIRYYVAMLIIFFIIERHHHTFTTCHVSQQSCLRAMLSPHIFRFVDSATPLP